MISKLRTMIATLSLLILTLTIPLAGLIFTPAWYEWNCQWHQRCLYLGKHGAQRYAQELGQFFLYRAPLTGKWSQRERLHLEEVRQLYMIIAIISILSVALLVGSCSYQPNLLSDAARTNLVMIAMLLLVVPFFGIFWKDLFHALIFNNDLWMTNADDISWYLIPRIFFRNSFIALITTGVIINAIIYLLARWRTGHR